MIRYLFIAAPLVLLLLSGLQRAHSKPVAEEWERVADPGRGLYRHSERRSAADPAPDPGMLREWRKDGSTLVMRVCYLGEFLKDDISSAYLDGLQRDFDGLRAGGMKAIMRFAYASSMEEVDQRQAGEVIVLRHIEQLAPVFRENSDVLHCVQAGFIGAWGEWHAVHPDFRASDGSLSPEASRRLMSALLNAVPEPIFLQVRTPWQKMMLFEADMEGAERVGHHNDCFLASDNDVGTYRDREGEMVWLEQQTETLPMGGETCGVSGTRSSGASALREMATLHFNYLNADYHPVVLEGWRQDGSYDEIVARLGHRVRLVTAANGPGGVMLTLINDGFAAPLYERPLEWRGTDGVARKMANFSMRSLKPGEKQSILLPGETLPIEVRLPDPAANLRERGEFCSRLVNVPVDKAGWHSISLPVELAK